MENFIENKGCKISNDPITGVSRFVSFDFNVNQKNEKAEIKLLIKYIDENGDELESVRIKPYELIISYGNKNVFEKGLDFNEFNLLLKTETIYKIIHDLILNLDSQKKLDI